MRLVGAHVVSLTDYLQVTWASKDLVPSCGAVLWSLFLMPPAGPARQLGYKIINGQFGAQFVFDFGTGQQHNLDDDVAVEGDALVARYPLTALDGLGNHWSWRATLNIDGRDVSEMC